MFSHVMVGVNDLEASKRVYDAVFAAMGVGPGITGKGRYYYRNATGTLGKMYQAYGRDPDGNKFCAVYRLPK